MNVIFRNIKLCDEVAAFDGILVEFQTLVFAL